MLLNELFDKVLKYEWTRSPTSTNPEGKAMFVTPDGSTYAWQAKLIPLVSQHDKDYDEDEDEDEDEEYDSYLKIAEIAYGFAVHDPKTRTYRDDTTGTGNAIVAFSTVIQILGDYANRTKHQYPLVYVAANDKRIQLYQRMLKRSMPSNYKVAPINMNDYDIDDNVKMNIAGGFKLIPPSRQ